MVDPTHHHRRIRQKAHVIHWGLLPLAFVVPGAWIFLAFDVCQETVDPFELQWCRYLQVTPLLPIAFGAAMAAWILSDLAHLGAHARGERTPELRHLRHGYRALEERHRRHVHLAFGQLALVALGLVAWLAYQIWRSTY